MSRKSNYVCLCISHKCANETVTLPSGETQAGKFVSCQTLNNHCKADERLYENTKHEVLQSVDSSTSSTLIIYWLHSLCLIITTDFDFVSVLHQLKDTLCASAVYLNIHSGLSRVATNRLLKAQNEAVSLAFDLGQAYERTPSISKTVTPSPATLFGPEDSQTAISHLGIDPVICRTLCCPTCLTLHPPDAVTCMTKVSNQSKACNTDLWTTHMTADGPRSTAKRHFYTQSLHEWLKFFLSRPGIEELIDQSYQHTPNPHIMGTVKPQGWEKFTLIPSEMYVNSDDL